LITVFHKELFCLSSIVDYDSTHLWLDCGADQHINSYLMNQDEIYMKATSFNIPLFLELTEGQLVTFQDKPTWRFKLPARIHKNQRRESFRVHFPVTLNSIVKIGAAQKKLSILDLSLTGFGLFTENVEGLVVGDTYQLYWEAPMYKGIPATKICLSVSVQHIAVLTKGKYKVGVKFENLNRQQEAFIGRWQNQLQLSITR
jgi:c-di-GMP-binding flagellar brake protein YcgR